MNPKKTMVTLVAWLCAVAIPAETAVPATGGARTLLQFAGVEAKPAPMSRSVLIIIDAQREYLDGRLPLAGIDASLEEAKRVLDRARRAGVPIIHVVQVGSATGALFKPGGPHVDIVPSLTPAPGEIVVTKRLPNAFAGTDLEDQLTRLGRKDLIVIGYMTHMCVGATVRSALDRGYRSTVIAGATATRDLPDSPAGVVPARDVQRASLAVLADRFAAVIQKGRDLED